MKQKRIVATIDYTLWKELSATLRAKGMTLTGWLRTAATDFVNNNKEK